jgi:microcystin-dependent protein
MPPEHSAVFAGHDVRRTEVELCAPDLQGRAPMHSGKAPAASPIWRTGGSETVSLLESEIPSHLHSLRADANVAESPDPSQNTLARASSINAYQTITNSNLVNMAPEALAPAGGDQPHNNLQPYLTFYFNIALQGVFPPRT